MATPTTRRLDANHDFDFGRGPSSILEGAPSTAQRAKCNLLLILGEFFLDLSAGVPWYQPDDSDVQSIFGMPADLGYAAAQVKKCILGTEGIATIETFDLSLNRNTRAMTLTCTVTDDDGNSVDIVLPVS